MRNAYNESIKKNKSTRTVPLTVPPRKFKVQEKTGSKTGVSIIFKIRVFYKARFEGFEFSIGWPYAVFHKMQVVFYKSAHFMYL